MSLLVGLPLKLFHLLFIVLKLVWPFLLFLLVWLLLRRRKRQTEEPQGASKKREKQEPTFRGPVYTVEYEEVKPDAEED